MAQIKYLVRIGWVSLAVAWCFDFLFWGKAPGISFFIFVVLCLVAGLLLAWSEGLAPAWRSLILIIPVIYFSAVSFLRLEPFTVMISSLATLALLALLANTLLGGRWFLYSLADCALGFLRLAGSMLVKPAEAIRELRKRSRTAVVEGEAPTAQAGRAARPAGAILRGILITVPVVAILAALLASADPVFGQGVRDVLRIFHIEKIGEYIFRGFYILIGAYLLAGVFLHGLLSSRDERLTGREKPWLQPFLGWTETGILLASVDVLFALFVAVQFRYFFGGQANISVAGYTYAEYARRGFGELVAVAVISLLLILGLTTLSKRETAGQRRFFTGLVAALVALVLVILVSAFQRLILYEDAYGFTRLRANTHAFIPWLGLLLLATGLLEAVRRPRTFALAAALAALGFGVTLSALNVDAFVARENIARAARGKELDLSYLATLSGDAVPVMVEQFHNPSLPQTVRDRIGASLVCRVKTTDGDTGKLPWQSFNAARAKAVKLLDGATDELKVYPTQYDPTGALQVTINGKTESCWYYGEMD